MDPTGTLMIDEVGESVIDLDHIYVREKQMGHGIILNQVGSATSGG